MNRNTKKMKQVLNAWETLAPDQTFANMTAAEFKARLQSITDMENARAALSRQSIESSRRLRDRTREGWKAAIQVINAVKGDVAHGDDSPLYAAMGYIRKSERRTGLTRASKITALPQALKAAA